MNDVKRKNAGMCKNEKGEIVMDFGPLMDEARHLFDDVSVEDDTVKEEK